MRTSKLGRPSRQPAGRRQQRTRCAVARPGKRLHVARGMGSALRRARKADRLPAGSVSHLPAQATRRGGPGPERQAFRTAEKSRPRFDWRAGNAGPMLCRTPTEGARQKHGGGSIVISKRRTFFLSGLAAGTASMTGTRVWAQSFPQKPIRFIVPLPLAAMPMSPRVSWRRHVPQSSARR